MILFLTMSLRIKVPFSFGCIPSSWLNLGFKATPYNKKGIKFKSYFLAKFG